MQYSATAFAKILRLIFQAVVRPERQVVFERPESPFVTDSIHYQESIRPVYERYLYEPLVDVMVHSARRVRRLQSGSLRLYLLFLFLTLLAVIVLAR